MESKKKIFEKELRVKIQQRLKGKETEEVLMGKVFKFMDIGSTGKVNFDQFAGAIARLGFAQERGALQELFKMYDTNGDGLIDYIADFINVVFGIGSEASKKSKAAAAAMKDTR